MAHMEKALRKNRHLLLTIGMVLILALGYYQSKGESNRIKATGKSPYQSVSLEQYVAQTEQKQYDNSVNEIKIFIHNNGESMHELYHPILEWQKNGTWCSLQKGEEVLPANFLFVESGEIKQFSVWMAGYGRPISGHYRVVFPVWGVSDDYIAAEFDIV